MGIDASRLPYEFTYGLAWFQPMPEVARIAEGLSAEMAAFGPVPDEDADEWPYAFFGQSLADFYTRAVKEGKAVIGGLA